ncbi:phage tail tape measure protein [Bacteroides caecigallinarum]|uniref:phage tail tape measure protein n=1 Tax=Bacteroides caecigallinarum TaxID=1411144 RepID=UPI00195844BA|nr:phage tail tape measure protein [Bacteroides caecigallinarum]MBM6865685.1 phage tail tape measure protein [Bacteroides caecigallinarum]
MASIGNKLARIDVLIGGADQARKQVEEMRKEWARLGKEIQTAQKQMEATVDTVDYDKNKAVYTEAVKQQKQLQKSIQETERNINTVQKYLADVSGQTLRNLNNARKGLNQMLLGINPKNFETLQTVRDYIKQIGDEIQRRKGNLIEFSDIMGNIGKVSDKSLGMAKQRLQELIATTEKNASEMQKYRDQLRQVEEEEQRRISSKAGRVMGNLDGSSVAEIQEAIKVTTQLRDAQKLGGQEWEIYNDEIQRAQKYLSDFNESGKQLAMSDRMKELGKASTASLTELKKYWQEQVNGAQRGSQELAEYEKQLKKVAEEENKRTRERAINIVGNLDSSSVSEIQEAIKSIEQLRDSTARGSQQWDFYNENLKAAKNYLQEYAESDRRNDIAQRMQNIGNASTASLAELKKFWQEQVDGAELSSQSLQQYQQQLEAVIKEEQKRLSQRAQSTLGSVQGGTFDKTIGETKEAIKLLEQYKQQLKVSDTQGIKDVDDAIKSLNERIKQASDSTMSLQDSLDLAEKVGKGTFDGTIEDLEKLKKSLEEYKKKTQVSNTEGLKEIDNALAKINKRQEEVKDGAFDLQKTLNNLKKAPLNDLQKAAAELQAELSKAERGTIEYIQASERLREVNGQIKEVKRSWEEHDNQIAATVKRLASYVLVYAGFNEVWGRIKQLYQANLELSDSMADIQKTTGLSAESVAELSKEIDGIDTRTAQQELHDLAYEAGKLGISAKEDVLGFVKAGNQLLVALGEDLGGAEAVRQLMKVNAILGETQKLGVEKALLATGSAINEISQTSRASAGPIVDIVTRIGAIGNAAGMSMSDLIALAGTVDALGQQSEMSGTALNTFISTLTSNTTEVAQAVGLSDDYLKNLISQGRTIEAIVAVFEKMNAMGGLDVLAPIMKDLGSDGERIKQVLVTLSSGVDELKAQVFTSSQAFKEATSVTDEYNIKNESAMAIMQRMGNAIKENFINSGFVEWITEVLRWMYNLPAVIERNRKAFLALKIVITEILILLAVAKWKAIMSMFVDFGKFLATPFTTIWRSLRIQIAASVAALEMAGKSTTGLIGKLRVLGKVIASNPWGLLATAVGAAVVYFADLNKKVSDAAEFGADYEVVLKKEQTELENLRFAISKANDENGERAALIKQLNDKYGAYLGFMVDENTYADKQAYIYKVINERLQETLALKMRDKMMENTVDRYSDKIQELNAQAIDALNEMERVGETNAGDAMYRIIRGIKKAAKEGLLPGDALKDFMDKYGYELNDIVYGKNRDLFTAAQGLLDIEKKIQEETKKTQQYLDGQTKAARATVNELMKADLEDYGEDFLSTGGVKELGTYVQQATTYVQRLRMEVDELNSKRQDGEKLTKEEEADLEVKKKLIAEYSGNIEQAQKRIRALGLESVWGQGLSLETAGVDKLVAAYARLEDMMKSINEDKDYAETFAARGFKSAKEEYEALKKMEQDIAKVLKDKWGRDTKGNWLKERTGGNRGEDKLMREEIDSAMSALEAYFLRRQQAIRQAYIDEQITTEEMNRQIDRTEEEHLLARVELRKRLLGQESTFNKDLYGMSDKDLDKLAGFLKKLGDRETDGMQKKLEEDLLTMMNNIIKYRQEIEKELRKYNPFETLVYQFEESLDKLQLLNPEFEKIAREMLGMSGVISQDEIKRRTEALVNLSQESYNLTELELRGRLQAIDKLWGEGMSPEQMSLMLKKLRDFYQDSKAAAEKYAKDISQMVEIQWQTSGKDKAWDDRIQNADDRAELMNAAGKLGLTSTESSFLGTSETDNAELEALRLRLEAAAEYYAQFESRKKEIMAQAMASGATQAQAEEAFLLAQKEAHDEYLSAREEQSAKELEITQSKLETLKGYTDAVVDFSYQMGEAAFGEVEDRKEAAKMLLQTTMKLTKDLIMQKIQELVMKKALGAQEVAQESATSATITAIHGSQAVTDLTVQGAKTTGKITAGIAEGSAVTIGQLGWWGIPLIAVISAALSALMGLAMGKLNKAKEEVASATGVSSSKGRVVAGMLTYAKGDYPVLGNDGQIYNARYQKELKTGVYSGGAHFGIFSEKKPEMIVDGDTTQKLILNYPHIYDSILTIARHGQLKQAAMPTYATGNYPAQTSGMNLQGQAVMTDMMSNAQMQDTLIQLSAAVSSLTERLNKPISATMDPYQANKTLKKTDKFMNKRGLI